MRTQATQTDVKKNQGAGGNINPQQLSHKLTSASPARMQKKVFYFKFNEPVFLFYNKCKVSKFNLNQILTMYSWGQSN